MRSALVDRLTGSLGAALVGTVAALVLGAVTARMGLVIGLALPLALVLGWFVFSRPLNGLIAGVVLILVIPYWYKKGVSDLQLTAGLALLSVFTMVTLQRLKLRLTAIDVAVAGLFVAAWVDWWLRGENFAAAKTTANTVLPLVFYLAARLLRGRAARVIMWVLVIAVTLASLTVFYEFAKGSPVFIPASGYDWNQTAAAQLTSIFRPGGVFGSPPAAVLALAMAALVAIVLLGECSGRRRRLLLGCLALIVAAGVLTFTRAGWIGFGVGLVVYVGMMWWRGRVRLPRWLAVVPAAAVVFVIALPAVSHTSLFQFGVNRGGTFTYRESIWTASLPLVDDTVPHLMFGRGLNSLLTGQETRLGGINAGVAETPSLITDGPQNQYVETLLEQGVLGIVLMAVWLGGALVVGVRGIGRVAVSDRRLVAGFTAATVCFLVESYVDSTFRQPNDLVIIAVLTGLLVSLCAPAETTP